MSAIIQHRGREQTQREQREYQALFCSTFLLFYTAALVIRLVRVLSGRAATDPLHGSLFAEAKAIGHSSLAFAFMG